MDNVRIIGIEDLIFWLNFFGLVAIIGFITANNILYSCFLLILIFIIGMCIFFIFNAIFLGLLILMVYIGAIATLFLFIILMVDLYTRIEQRFDSEKLLSIISLCCMLLLMYCHFYGGMLNDYIIDLCSGDLTMQGEYIHSLHEDNWVKGKPSFFSQVYYVPISANKHPDSVYSYSDTLSDVSSLFASFRIEQITLRFSAIPTDIVRIGKIFYTYFCILFILCAFSLLVAILGILIASEYGTSRNNLYDYEGVIERKQRIAEQLNKLYTVEITKNGLLTKALCIIPTPPKKSFILSLLK